MEKLPLFIHGNLDHRSGGEEHCGGRTPVAIYCFRTQQAGITKLRFIRCLVFETVLSLSEETEAGQELSGGLEFT